MTRRQPIPAEALGTTPETVTEAYCILSGYVNERVFDFSMATDCFCPANREQYGTGAFWRHDNEAYAFIVEAVEEAIARRRTYVAEARVKVQAIDRDQAAEKVQRLLWSDDVAFHIEEAT